MQARRPWLYWRGGETRANSLGGERYAPEAPVVERARGRRARRAGRCDSAGDGKQWNTITDWIAPDQALVRPLVEASAAQYAQDKGITPWAFP
jgi:hypothetical protein